MLRADLFLIFTVYQSRRHLCFFEVFWNIQVNYITLAERVVLICNWASIYSGVYLLLTVLTCIQAVKTCFLVFIPILLHKTCPKLDFVNRLKRCRDWVYFLIYTSRFIEQKTTMLVSLEDRHRHLLWFILSSFHFNSLSSPNDLLRRH